MGSLASSYTNFGDLLAGVANGIEEAVRGVAPQIETRLQVSAEQNVYSKNGRKNGITSAKNIVSSVTREGNVVTMVVKDIAKPQGPKWGTFDEAQNNALEGTMFANWIEHGLWMDIVAWASMGYPKDDDKPKRPARPFIAPAQVEAAMIVKTALHNL